MTTQLDFEIVYEKARGRNVCTQNNYTPLQKIHFFFWHTPPEHNISERIAIWKFKSWLPKPSLS